MPQWAAQFSAHFRSYCPQSHYPASSAVAAEQDRRITVEHLLEEGWEITGYTGTADNRSSLMLFKHRDRKFLVQCAIFYDVTRAPRTNVNCYELH